MISQTQTALVMLAAAQWGTLARAAGQYLSRLHLECCWVLEASEESTSECHADLLVVSISGHSWGDAGGW